MTLRIAVTGAGGFIGSHLVRLAHFEGHAVCALVRSGPDADRLADVDPDVFVLSCELHGTDANVSKLSAWRPDVLVHAAWQDLRGDARAMTAAQLQNVRLTVATVDLAAAAGVRAWISVGSQEEGLGTAYGMAKAQAREEAMDRARHSGLDAAWLRLTAAYGPSDDPRRLVPAAICAALAGRAGLFTKGEQLRDLLYIEDAAQAILAAAAARLSGVFDVASGDPLLVRDLIELIAELVGYKGPMGIGKLPYRGEEPMVFSTDPQRLRSATGWAPRIPLRVGLERTVDWYRSHPQACR